MKVRSGHIRFEKGVEYKDFIPIFPEMYHRFLEDTAQVPDEEEVVHMMIKENLIDLERNKKPEGYNRQGRMRMIFPIQDETEDLEVYIYGHYHSAKSLDVARVTESMSRFLKSKGFENDVDWDKMLIHKYKK